MLNPHRGYGPRCGHCAVAAACALLLQAAPTNASTVPSAPTPPALASESITVTSTREAVRLWDVPASIGLIGSRSLREAAPAHPQQIMSQIPGVAVAVTNGEGHTTAIRQPFTTAPLYLFLEDGIPTRPTGFFNHNALYEVNLPDAARIEVVRGPGSALYGSDAIGGLVNVITRAAIPSPAGGGTIELGAFGWKRLMGEAQWAQAKAGTDTGLRVSLNRTHSDGWREATAYDRTSLSLRWDHAPSQGLRAKTIISATDIDQQTGANTPLPLADYRQNPRLNNFSIAFRQVQALRASSEFEWSQGRTLWTLTPYARLNGMKLNGSFNLASDPRIEDTEVSSLGLLAKVRHDISAAWDPRVILGVDLDRSSGSRTEDALNVSRAGTGASTRYIAYTVGPRVYDYTVAVSSVSPYAQMELKPLDSVQLTLGLRHDSIGFDMQNRLSPTGSSSGVPAHTVAGTRFYGQLPDADKRFERLSTKLGATWTPARDLNLFASLNEGFRAPSESQLFRGGPAANPVDASNRARLALGLQPIQARQAEAGLRTQWGAVSSEWVVYRLDKRNDLVTQRDLATNLSTAVNAGHTRHQGLEWSLGAPLNRQWRVDAAWSWARHRYVDWVTATASFSGKEMESAPRVVGNTRLSWRPDNTRHLQLEWSRIGPYWLEASNSSTFGRYEGHDVFNLRASHRLNRQARLFMRVTNLRDTRHADSASVSSNTAVYSPALPRAVALGLEVNWP
jgi:outer membrane receptor protein involved in Fe transport